MYNNVMTTQTTIYVLCFKENQKCFCSFSYYLLEDAWDKEEENCWLKNSEKSQNVHFGTVQ